MQENNLTSKPQSEGIESNIIFGTSSNDIERGLHNEQFIDETGNATGGDDDQIVNEQEQNEIVNPSEETFNEDPAPAAVSADNTLVKENKDQSIELDEKSIAVNPEKDLIDNAGKISKAED